MSLAYSESAERAILGAILAGSVLTPDLLRRIPAEAWYAERHRLIWSVMTKIASEGLSPDLLVVSERIKGVNLHGGDAYLMELADEHVSDSGLDSYVTLVKDAHVRRIAAVNARILAEAARESETAGEVVEKSLQLSTELLEASRGEYMGPKNPMAAAGRILTNERPPRIRTGFSFLDDYFFIRPTTQFVLGARPGCGKTSMAMGVGINVAKNGKRVMVNSLEMDPEELTESIMAHQTGIKLDRIINRVLSPAEMEECRLASLSVSNIEFVQCRTVAELQVKARAMKLSGGLDLLIVDYLQLMEEPGSESRNQEVGSVSRGLKRLAMSLGCANLVLSQLSRMKDRSEPTLTDLRESGEIEQDANMVAFLWEGDDGERRVKGAKNRRGQIMPARPVDFDGSIVRFYDRVNY